MICIVEEPNLRHIKVSILKSSYMSYIVAGHNFYVTANFCKDFGWLVRVACCHEEDEVLNIPPNAHYVNETQFCLTF